MWLTTILALTLTSTLVTSQVEGCSLPRRYIGKYDLIELCGEGEAFEVPEIPDVLMDLKNARASIRDNVTKQDVRRAIEMKTQSFDVDSPVQVTSVVVSEPRWCCPAPTYDCQSIRILPWFLHWHFIPCLFIKAVSPSRFLFVSCRCRKCLYKDDCFSEGTCVATDYRSYIIIVYCLRTRSFHKLYITVPTSCRCMTGCPRSAGVFTQQRIDNGFPKMAQAAAVDGTIEKTADAETAQG